MSCINLGISRGCDNERVIEVSVDHERDERIVLANLVLLRIDLTCHDLIKVESSGALTRAALGLEHVQLSLHLLLESHDHVETVTVEDLEDKHVRSLVSILDRNHTSQNALVVQVRLIDQVFNLASFVLWCEACCGDIGLSENINGFSGLLIQLEE